MKKIFISALLSFNLAGCYTLKNSDFSDHSYAPVTDEILSPEQNEAVHKYAPVIFQETNKKANPEHWDFITSIDFDGDLQSNNNEKSIKSNKNPLPATVYYSLVESETHYFIVYSLFHPLDWDTVPDFIPFTWHENDMENIQVVIRKKTAKLPESVVLLATQAHIDTQLSSASGSDISSSEKIKLTRQKVSLLSDNLTGNGTHTGLYVESGGHGIYNMNSNTARFASLQPPQLKEGFTFIPASATDNTPDTYSKNTGTYRYQLKSSYDNFWANYVNKTNMGNGKLMDGYFNYKDELVDCHNIPRHFDSSRLSGPGKFDSGILPFAFSYNLNASDLGVIFFNPARKYSETLKISGEWSKKYLYNPYVRDVLKVQTTKK
jgi:hypothetical protein